MVAGLGNIYSQALSRARISPLRPPAASRAEAETLVEEVRAVLDDAIAAGGSTLRDYRQADGELGYFQHPFPVYDREGEPCPRCGGTIVRTCSWGLLSFWCPACQI